MMLATAALSGDKSKIISAMKSIIHYEKDNSTLKKSLARLIQHHNGNVMSLNQNASVEQQRALATLKGMTFADEQTCDIHSLILEDEVSTKALSFLRECDLSETLIQHGLSPANKMLLTGPPGNGKTSLAGAVARHAGLPLFTVDFSRLIKSELGSTQREISTVLRAAGTIPCVLFIDEFETVMSERATKGTRVEVGEVARIVSTLLLEFDRLPTHTIAIAATNHEEMLDSAVGRRFEYKLNLDTPTELMKSRLVKKLAIKFPAIPIVGLHEAHEQTLSKLASMAELEQSLLVLAKQWVLDNERQN